MLHKTRGIVLKTTPYAESSVVVQIFTEKFGMQAYLVNGVKKPRAKIGLNILQPFHLLDLVVYHKLTGSLQRISEARQTPIFQRIPYDVIKSSIAQFLNELVYKSMKQQGPDEALFDFIFHAICWLDALEHTPANFHLYFLLKLTKFLGFYPASNGSNRPFFDLKEGTFTSYLPNHSLVLQNPHTTQWATILNSNWSALHGIKIPHADRRILLHRVVDFYQLHLDAIGEIKSLEILEEVLG
ncbi:DNA repair protein RecO [Olivibacter ginsenosidimutans]|uniref:DNA repair protein RecO n=1 Tax=Olivibacter ginsenosidimutans TaxID=1176537 RepID=UPI0031EF5121